MPARAQEKARYELTPFPDVWYNKVDGVRAGVRFLGEMEGSFKDGPHRLDAGVWLGTNIPVNPVSYYISFTEPLFEGPRLGNETNVQLESLFRTGYLKNGISVNKRFQPGFDELNHTELSIFYSAEKLTNADYRPFPQLWQHKAKHMLGGRIKKSGNPDTGPYYLAAEILQNLSEPPGQFTVITAEAGQKIHLSGHFKLRVQGFAGYAGTKTAPEYLFSYSYGQARNWLESGFSRAAGTVPVSWLSNGHVQFSGSSLRGYAGQEAKLLKAGAAPAYTSIWSLNTEFEFPNPLNAALKSINVIGDLAELRSYLFFDAGKAYKEYAPGTADPHKGLFALADAGPGFQLSVNIPDYLGKNRGLFLRYDVPLWISAPELNENKFRYRQVIGIGALFHF